MEQTRGQPTSGNGTNPDGGRDAHNGLGHGPGHRARDIRYGVVGLGWFAQAAILPSFAHAKKNSRLAALFSGSSEKLRELGDRYDVSGRYSYDQLETAIRAEGLDAVYIALPNHLHRYFTVRAARAGAHVLCEKPMAVTAEDCEVMSQACEDAGVKLMIAYRLHFEEANLTAMERVESERFGRALMFEAVFANSVTDPDNIRLGPLGKGGGSLYDIGIYCINAARHVFRSEPEEVLAVSLEKDPASGCEVTTAAILRFPGDRLATFTSSFAAADHDHYTVHGTKGTLRVQPAFQRKTLRHRFTIGERSCEVEFPERDQVAPELLYFSDCIIEDREPRPNGREGLADVRVIEALHHSAAERRAIPLAAFHHDSRPEVDQPEHRPPVAEQELVDATPPSGS